MDDLILTRLPILEDNCDIQEERGIRIVFMHTGIGLAGIDLIAHRLHELPEPVCIVALNDGANMNTKDICDKLLESRPQIDKLIQIEALDNRDELVSVKHEKTKTPFHPKMHQPPRKLSHRRNTNWNIPRR